MQTRDDARAIAASDAVAVPAGTGAVRQGRSPSRGPTRTTGKSYPRRSASRSGRQRERAAHSASACAIAATYASAASRAACAARWACSAASHRRRGTRTIRRNEAPGRFRWRRHQPPREPSQGQPQSPIEYEPALRDNAGTRRIRVGGIDQKIGALRHDQRGNLEHGAALVP